MKRIEGFAPNPDASELHEIEIAAPPDAVYRTLWTADLGGSPIVKALLALRSLPARISGRQKPRAARSVTLRDIVAAGFGVLDEAPGDEVVLGVSGRFWLPTGNLAPFDREAFSRPIPPGMARAVWNFRVAPSGSERTTLSTETRVTCADAASRLKFRLYWAVVRPFSGLIRILMLNAVRRAVERR